MYVLNVIDVNDALPAALFHLYRQGKREDTRNGPAIVAPEPVTTVYSNPRRRVLFDSRRDANPFFHLFESLWILAGQSDVKFLSWFNSRIAQYSDDGIIFHAPYGWRLRKHFGFDQITKACAELKQNPFSRRVVLQIWDPAADLCTQSKDLPCNDLLMLRVVDGNSLHPSGKSLDLAVCNRSNDAVWGAYGANAVQFSMLQEYMAEHIGIGIGTYRQVSNNLHVYEDNPYWAMWIKNGAPPFATENAYDWPQYVHPVPLVNTEAGESIEDFDCDLAVFFNIARHSDSFLIFTDAMSRIYKAGGMSWRTAYFREVVEPMLFLYRYRDTASEYVRYFNPGQIDWHLVGVQWVERRKAAALSKEASK